MYTNTAKSHTEYGQHNRPHTVTLSASKTNTYILINNHKFPPLPSLSNWRPASRLPFRATAASAVCDTKSMGILTTQCHCALSWEVWGFLTRPRGARGCTDNALSVHRLRVKPIQRSPSLFIVQRSRQPGSGKSTDQFRWSMYRSVGQSVLSHRREYCFTDARLL